MQLHLLYRLASIIFVTVLSSIRRKKYKDKLFLFSSVFSVVVSYYFLSLLFYVFLLLVSAKVLNFLFSRLSFRSLIPVTFCPLLFYIFPFLTYLIFHLVPLGSRSFIVSKTFSFLVGLFTLAMFYLFPFIFFFFLFNTYSFSFLVCLLTRCFLLLFPLSLLYLLVVPRMFFFLLIASCHISSLLNYLIIDRHLILTNYVLRLEKRIFTFYLSQIFCDYTSKSLIKFFNLVLKNNT